MIVRTSWVATSHLFAHLLATPNAFVMTMNVHMYAQYRQVSQHPISLPYTSQTRFNMASVTENGTHNTELITLSRHVLHEQQTRHKEASGDLTLLLVSIQLGCKFVATSVRKAGLVNLYDGSARVCASVCLRVIVCYDRPRHHSYYTI